jgi:hypothetical protein
VTGPNHDEIVTRRWIPVGLAAPTAADDPIASTPAGSRHLP